VFAEKGIEKIRPLEQRPRMGRIVPEIGDKAIREILHRTYPTVDGVDQNDEEVDVLTIFHSSRQFGALGSDDE